MFRNIALVLLGVLFVSELRNSYHDDKVKVYLLLTQSGEENTTLLPIVLSSNFPENISLKDLLRSVPDYCKINVPYLGIETGVSANVHNHTTMMEEPLENKSDIYRKHIHQFSNKSKHLSASAVKKNRSYNQSIILKTLQSKAMLKYNKTMVHNSEPELKYNDGNIDNQSNINKSLAQAVTSKNDTRDDLEENHTSSNTSQGVIYKKLHSKGPVKSSNIVTHSSQHKLSNNNETINNENSTKKNISAASVSRNVSGEEVYGNHDVRDVYYVVHSCSEQRCRIHQVVVLKRGTVQAEDMEAILKTFNESQYSSHNRYGGVEEWIVSFSAVISGLLLSNIINIQWLLPALLSLSVTLLIILICRIYTYKKNDDTYLFMEETISDIKELAGILMDSTTAQDILERRIMLACTKETNNETQIKNMKNEIAHLKITVRRMNGNNSVNMDDFVTSVLIHLRNCLESGADTTSDDSQQWLANEPNDLNSYGQLS